jgi:A/G-specific adenine glycosylase
VTVLDQATARTAFRRALLRWYRRSARDLPWRSTRDPYLIWLSEAMLQQTQVATVIPYFERFRSRYPTVAELAAAPQDDVLKLWEGLGYYSRARNLHRAAQEIAQAGQFPRSAAQWQALPGIGRYSSAAIASIASGEPVAVVDGNVKRVLARVHAIRESISDGAIERQLWQLADGLLARRSAGDHNQAMMELGARICRPRRPDCDLCPVRRYCAADRQGIAEQLPVKMAKPKAVELQAQMALVECRNKLLVRRRPSRGIFGGLWEFPTIWSDNGRDFSLPELIEKLTGQRARLGEVQAVVAHALTHRRITLEVYRISLKQREAIRSGGDERRWLRRAELDQVALSQLYHKALAALPE